METDTTLTSESLPPPPEKRGVSKRVWVIAAALVIAGVGIAWVLLFANRTYDLSGSLTAPECGGGYEIENASVEIRDQNDKLIGSGTTGINENVDLFGSCLVKFETQVPKASFYQITIGTHGGPSYSFAEMEANNWQLELSLGGDE